MYDDETTQITATSPLVLESKLCENTGMWKLDLNRAISLPNQHPKKHSTLFLSSQVPVKHSSGTMHPQVSQQKLPSLKPSATATTPHGQN